MEVQGAPTEAAAVRPRRAGSEDTEEPVDSNQVVSVLSWPEDQGHVCRRPSRPTLLLLLKDPPEPTG